MPPSLFRSSRILLLTTGGTIDSHPYPDDPKDHPVDASPKKESPAAAAMRRILNNSRPPCALKHHQICYKDSKNLDEHDLNSLIKWVQRPGYIRIVVTMGTDRICQIAQDFEKQLNAGSLLPPCPVVFTGALWPLMQGADQSDGLSNLQNAALGNPGIPSGFYIAAGSIFAKPHRVEKDFKHRRFVLKDETL